MGQGCLRKWTGFGGWYARSWWHINASSGSGDTRLVNVLYPTTEASWSTRPNIEMLAENETAMVMRLDDSRNLNTDDETIQWFEAVFEDDAVSLYGEMTTPVRLYAPAALRLFVNDRPAPFVRSGDYILLREDTVSPRAPTGIKATQD